MLVFKSHGSARGSFDWDEFCEIELPVPSIEKQHEIVKEYNTIVNRIKLNEQLNQKLEETAQAIYKHWFVDFEFPTEALAKDGISQPYKSSGGDMVWHEELGKEIPMGWESCSFKELAIIEDGDRGKNYPSKEELLQSGYCLFLSAENVSYTGFRFDINVYISKDKDQSLGNGKLKRYDIVITSRGSSIGKLGYYGDSVKYQHIRVNSGMLILRAHSIAISIYLFTMLKSFSFQSEIKGYLSGSAQPQIPIRDLVKIPILKPNDIVIEKFYSSIKILQRAIDINTEFISKMESLYKLILSKMTKVESEKETV